MIEKVALTFIGPPTCGKSSIAQRLSQELRLPLIEGHNILPEESLALKAERRLIPDDRFVPALLHQLASYPGHLIMDNIPRTIVQAEALTTWATQTDHILAVIHLLLTEDQVLIRAQSREVCSECNRSFHPQLQPTPTPGYCPDHNIPLIKRPGDNSNTVIKGYKDHLITDLPLVDYLATHEQLVFTLDANTPTVEQAKIAVIHTLFQNPIMRQVVAELK